MNRRELIKRGAVGAAVLGIGGPGILLQTACGSTTQLVRWTTAVIGALNDVAPILGEMGQSSIVALVARAVPIAEQLKKAFENNDHASTLQFLDNLINPQTGIIVQIADQVANLSDARKKFVEGILALGMVALHLIAANIQQNVPSAAAARARAARPSAVGAVEKAARSGALEKAFQATRF